MVIIINIAYSRTPSLSWHGYVFTTGDAITGCIYIVRDFAQRAIGQKVIFAMLAASLLSYFMSASSVALASVAAFVVAESIDWAIYSFTKKPLSQRLLYSSMLSTPIDSLVFLLCINRLRVGDMIVMTAAKWLGVVIIWMIWRSKNNNKSQQTRTFNVANQSNPS